MKPIKCSVGGSTRSDAELVTIATTAKKKSRRQWAEHVLACRGEMLPEDAKKAGLAVATACIRGSSDKPGYPYIFLGKRNWQKSRTGWHPTKIYKTHCGEVLGRREILKGEPLTVIRVKGDLYAARPFELKKRGPEPKPFRTKRYYAPSTI